jgi:hypothetical protein
MEVVVALLVAAGFCVGSTRADALASSALVVLAIGMAVWGHVCLFG